MEIMLQEIEAAAPRESSEARAVFFTGKAYGIARGVVACSWWAGRALNEVKEKLEHGEFGPWLKSVDILDSTASRWMRVAEGYSLEDLLEVGTVNQALDLQERYDKVKAERDDARKALIAIAEALAPCAHITAVEAGRCIEKAFSIAEGQKREMFGELTFVPPWDKKKKAMPVL